MYFHVSGHKYGINIMCLFSLIDINMAVLQSTSRAGFREMISAMLLLLLLALSLTAM